MTNQNEIVSIPLNKLVQSPYNVRKTRSEEELELGYVRKDDLAAYETLCRLSRPQGEAEEDQQTEQDDAQDDSATEEGMVEPPLPSPGAGLSDALLTDLHAARTMALRLELANRPDVALRAVAHSLAGRILAHDTGALTVIAREVYVPAISKTHCPDDETVQNRLSHWKLRLSTKSGALWDDIMALPEADLQTSSPYARPLRLMRRTRKMRIWRQSSG